MAKISLNTWDGRYRSKAFWWVTAFGAGLLKPAPGTWGSLLGLASFYGMVWLGNDLIEMISFLIAITIASSKTISFIEDKAGIHDAPEIVIDEVAGQWLTLLPLIVMPHPAYAYLAGFLLFRLFDIIKPWPISWLDRHVGGGFGVMVDDLVAGFFAGIGLWLLLTFELLG